MEVDGHRRHRLLRHRYERPLLHPREWKTTSRLGDSLRMRSGDDGGQPGWHGAARGSISSPPGLNTSFPSTVLSRV